MADVSTCLEDFVLPKWQRRKSWQRLDKRLNESHQNVGFGMWTVLASNDLVDMSLLSPKNGLRESSQCPWYSSKSMSEELTALLSTVIYKELPTNRTSMEKPIEWMGSKRGAVNGVNTTRWTAGCNLETRLYIDLRQRGETLVGAYVNFTIRKRGLSWDMADKSLGVEYRTGTRCSC